MFQKRMETFELLSSLNIFFLNSNLFLYQNTTKIFWMHFETFTYIKTFHNFLNQMLHLKMTNQSWYDYKFIKVLFYPMIIMNNNFLSSI